MSNLSSINKEFAHTDIVTNSLLDFGERAAGRVLFVENAIITGTGIVNLNVFKLLGTVRVFNTWAQITEVTTLTNLTGMYADAWDGTNSVVLTKTSGADLSGAPVGTFFTKDRTTVEAYSVSLADQVRVIESLAKNSVPFYITQKSLTDTFIRFNFSTTDAPVSFKMSVWFEYIPINGGSLTLV